MIQQYHAKTTDPVVPLYYSSSRGIYDTGIPGSLFFTLLVQGMRANITRYGTARTIHTKSTHGYLRVYITYLVFIKTLGAFYKQYQVLVHGYLLTFSFDKRVLI